MHILDWIMDGGFPRPDPGSLSRSIEKCIVFTHIIYPGKSLPFLSSKVINWLLHRWPSSLCFTSSSVWSYCSRFITWRSPTWASFKSDLYDDWRTANCASWQNTAYTETTPVENKKIHLKDPSFEIPVGNDYEVCPAFSKESNDHFLSMHASSCSSHNPICLSLMR